MSVPLYPTSEAELVEAFIGARVRVIGEFSGSLRRDCRKLQRWAKAYVEAQGIEGVPMDDETCGIYYEDDEQDAEINAELDSLVKE